MSQQGLRQAALRAATGRGSENLSYEGDWHALWDMQGIAAGTFNERMLLWINTRLSASHTNINDALAAFAVSEGADNFNSLGTFDAQSIERAIASNRNMLPSTTAGASANYVRQSRLMFTVPDNATYTDVRAYFPGWGQNSGGEFPSPDAQTITSSIEYGGSVYQATFNNSTVAVNGGEWGSYTGLTLLPGTSGFIITKAVGANTGSVARLIGQGTKPFFGEGAVNGTNPALDYTNGVYGKGAIAGTPVVTTGNIASCPVTNGGTNYTTGPSVYAYEQQPNGTIAWKTIGYGVRTGSAISSITITSGTPPAGVAAWVNPTVVIGNAFSSNTSVYGPAIITGQPDSAVNSVVIHGTSIEIGWGSTDAIGDFERNFGIYERGLQNRCGVFNLASLSQTYAGYSNQATFAKTYALLASLGATATHSIIGAPTNDVQSGTALATVKTQVNAVRTAMVANGHKVDFALLLPRTSSSDSFATVVNQTEATGFGAGGVAELYNADVISGVLVSDGVGNIDGRTQFADAVATRKWDVSVSKTTDGIHPTEIGLWVASNNATFTAEFSGYA